MPNIPVILLADNDPAFSNSLAQALEEQGNKVFTLPSLSGIAHHIKDIAPDAILLGTNFEFESTYDIIADIKQHVAIPLIFFTEFDEVDHRVQGINAGGDASLAKPVNVRELGALVQSLMKRYQERDTLNQQALKSWHLNPDASTLTCPNNRILKLTKSEFALIHQLANSNGDPVERQALMVAMNKGNSSPYDRALDVLISRLKKKYKDSNQPLPIRSIRNVGYAFLEEIKITGT